MTEIIKLLLFLLIFRDPVTALNRVIVAVMLPALVTCVTRDLIKFKFLTSFMAGSNFYRSIHPIFFNYTSTCKYHKHVRNRISNFLMMAK